MQRLLSFHLLGILLLLSQLPRESRGQNWDTVIKACGRELARLQIRICGNSLSSWEDINGPRVRRESGPLTEIKPTSKKTDEETLKMISEYIAKLLNRTLSLNHPITLRLQQLASENKDISFEEFQEIISTEFEIHMRYIPSKSEESDKQPRKKRQVLYSLSNKCCHSGCTLREVARFC
ncbi:prorelaxin-like [Sorex araneus]|uniref:prorelaxin-like n=1 Tax=Sorex araneus TaxID=42254 RepID=UPI0003316A7B|nr:prorelaxin-like [Sorex araneus]